MKIESIEEAMRIRALPPVYDTSPKNHHELAERMKDIRVHELSSLKNEAEQFIREEMSRHVRIAMEKFPHDNDACNRYIMDKQDELDPQKDPEDDWLMATRTDEEDQATLRALSRKD